MGRFRSLFQAKQRRVRRCIWHRTNRGAVMLEGALVMSFILIPLCFGVIEYSNVAVSSNRLRQISGDAAKSISEAVSVINDQGLNRLKAEVVSEASYSDLNGLMTIKSSMTPLQFSQIQRIIVYKADNFTSTAPQACRDFSTTAPTSSISGTCNVYLRSDLDALFVNCPGQTEDDLRTCFDQLTAKNSWPAVSGGSLNRLSAVDNADNVGVLVVVKQPMITKLFGTSTQITGNYVYRHEPQSFATPQNTTAVPTTVPNTTPVSNSVAGGGESSSSSSSSTVTTAPYTGPPTTRAIET
jgi:hypothetical protein